MSNQPQIQLPPMIVVGNTWLAPQAILALDFEQYQPGKSDRLIIVYIVGPHVIELDGQTADAFYLWWGNLTGTNKVQPAPLGLAITKP